MKTRIITAAVGLVVLGVVLALFNTWVFEFVVACIALLAIHEAYMAFGFGKKEGYIFGIFVPYTLWLMFSNVPVIKMLLVPASLVLVVYLAVCLIWHSQTLSVAKLGGMVALSAIILTCFYSIVFIKHQLPVEQYSYEAVYLILLVLAFAWGGDSTAYFAGRFFGKHKLAPVVSPHKTVEGAIGGVIGSGVLGVLCTLAARAVVLQGLTEGSVRAVQYFAGNTFGYLAVFLLGMFCSVLGILGDLFASAVKRQCEIKDYGTIFPGHGGILDRFDSVLFIAPTVAVALWLVSRLA